MAQSKMYGSNWEVIAQEGVGAWTVKVWLIEKSYKPSVAHIKDGHLELSEIKEGSDYEVEPTFSLNMDAWRAIKMAMLNNVEREKSTIEAELGATKYHLEDLRKLVFKEKK